MRDWGFSPDPDLEALWAGIAYAYPFDEAHEALKRVAARLEAKEGRCSDRDANRKNGEARLQPSTPSEGLAGEGAA